MLDVEAGGLEEEEREGIGRRKLLSYAANRTLLTRDVLPETSFDLRLALHHKKKCTILVIAHNTVRCQLQSLVNLLLFLCKMKFSSKLLLLAVVVTVLFESSQPAVEARPSSESDLSNMVEALRVLEQYDKMYSQLARPR